MTESYLIIVEGKNDRNRLRHIVPEHIPIVATYGIPSGNRLEQLRVMGRGRTVVVMTDADAAGRRIRQRLKDVFPDAVDVHTKPGFNGVEHTPVEFLEGRLRQAGLLEPVESPLFGVRLDGLR